MAYARIYGGLIWTNHALERLAARRLSQELAWTAFRYPDSTRAGSIPGAREYQRKHGNSLITLIVKENEKKERVVLSAWIDPPFPGTEDERKHKEWKAYQRSPWWKKWLLTLKKSLGL